MKGNRRFSLIDRFVAGKSRSSSPGNSDAVANPTGSATQLDSHPGGRLKGASLEQAYRDLMLENQVLAESNQRLHERLARVEGGLEESPAAKQLIRAQRNALAERSHQLREVQYENLNLKREQKKLVKENRQLFARLEQQTGGATPLPSQDQLSRRELDEAKAALREKSNELARLTDKYYQLQARSKSGTSRGSAAGGSRF